ncbi:MAG TPA: DUF4112 domain-containing protein [Xanthomonadales bacterium]|nr:DUF4112 domain-containing protein [Xanthomonadales bacterium]
MVDAARAHVREVSGEVESRSYVADVERARRLARLLDTAVAIPGTNIRFGLDALLGLVPGVGDAVGTLLSSQIVIAAARSGVPTLVIIRMLLNLVVDTVVGAVPVLGDLFDVVFRSNQRNLELLERHHGRSQSGRSARHRIVLAAAAIVTIAFVLAALGLWLAFAGVNAVLAGLR